MHFTEEKPAGNYIINGYSKNTVTINHECYENSLYLSPNKLITPIPFQTSLDLTRDGLEFIIQMRPEIVLLGSGKSLEFPSASIIAHFASNNIGFETMDHAAACRTYSVLSTEHRDVGALFLLNPQT